MQGTQRKYKSSKRKNKNRMINLAIENTHKWIGVRKHLIRAQGGLCGICSKQMTLKKARDNTATIDHIIPISKGGLDKPSNLRAACYKCNNIRGNNVA